MYDPYLQRFLSPDNEIQAPGDAQSYNRYTYCMNNPLMYTDPSGYTWFTQLGNWLGSTGRTIAEVAVGIGVGIAVTALTGGLDLITVGVLCGMAAGASSGALSTAFSGGNFNDYLNAIAQGASYGGITGLASIGAITAIGYAIQGIGDAIGTGWDELGNIAVSQPYPNEGTLALWNESNNNWLSVVYRTISNIGSDASSATSSTISSIASSSLSVASASGLAATLGNQALYACTNYTDLITSGNGNTYRPNTKNIKTAQDAYNEIYNMQSGQTMQGSSIDKRLFNFYLTRDDQGFHLKSKLPSFLIPGYDDDNTFTLQKEMWGNLEVIKMTVTSKSGNFIEYIHNDASTFNSKIPPSPYKFGGLFQLGNGKW